LHFCTFRLVTETCKTFNLLLTSLSKGNLYLFCGKVDVLQYVNMKEIEELEIRREIKGIWTY
jgi:hypothetical protein